METLTCRSLRSLTCTLSVLLLGVGGAGLHGQVFTETFNATNPTTSNSAAVGWVSYIGDSSHATTVTNVSNYTVAQMNATTPPVNYTMLVYTTPAPNTGFIATVNSATGNPGIANAAFKFLPTSVDLSHGGSATWNMGNTATTAAVRVLLQINGTGTANSGTWLATTLSVTNRSSYLCASASAFNTVLTSGGDLTNYTYSLDLSNTASNWTSFTFDPASNSMSLGTALTGSPVDLSQVTALGFYTTWTSGSFSAVRIDNLNVVPEPATALLLLPALTGLAFARRWQRKSSRA